MLLSLAFIALPLFIAGTAAAPSRNHSLLVLAFINNNNQFTIYDPDSEVQKALCKPPGPGKDKSKPPFPIGANQPCNISTYQWNYASYENENNITFGVAHTIYNRSNRETAVKTGTVDSILLNSGSKYSEVHEVVNNTQWALAPNGWTGDPIRA